MKKNTKILIISVISIIGLILLIAIGYSLFMRTSYISKDRVKEIILNDTKLNAKDISFTEIDLDLDGELKKYEVEFYYNRVEYKYEIDAKTGNIIYSNFINLDNNANTDTNTNNPNNNTSTNTDNNNYISKEEAKNIALADAGFNSNEVIFIDVELEFENGRAIYDVDFENNILEYEYKIDAVNKGIISKRQEPRD